MEQNMPEQAEAQRAKNIKNLIVGLALIAAGCIFLTDRYDLIPELNWRTLIPALIVFFGAIDLLFAGRSGRAANGFFRILIGAWLYMVFNHIWDWSFENSWPVAVIALGLKVLLHGLLTDKS